MSVYEQRDAVARAFEHLGDMRERITDLQTLAADLDDNRFSSYVARLLAVNTLAIGRAHELLTYTQTTDAPSDHLDSDFAGGARGG